jgi:hypothetical protein
LADINFQYSLKIDVDQKGASGGSRVGRQHRAAASAVFVTANSA